MDNYFLELKAIPPSCYIKILTDDKLFKKLIIWEFTKEIKPIDIYCYMYAKYGKPNGIQNDLRNDSSENFIHWEWALASKFGIVLVQGHQFRTEAHLFSEHQEKNLTRDHFIRQIKSDFKNYGKAISSVRTALEKWTRFVNPYYRINSVVSKNIKSLRDLDIKIEEYRDLVKPNNKNLSTLKENWEYVQDKCDSEISMAFGIRCMLPVLAESFINLLIFILVKPNIRTNDSAFSDIIRENINIRVQSLHLHCVGFKNPINYTDDRYKKFHTLMNERNDLLHGNVNVKKLKIGEVYFNNKVPVFVGYEDMWQSTIGIFLDSVKYNTIFEDRSVVTSFIEFILSHLSNDAKEVVESIMDHSELGHNSVTGRVGALFADYVDCFRMSDKTGS